MEGCRGSSQQLFRPPALLPGLPSTPEIREPTVGTEDAAESKNVKGKPSGIGGWLGLLVFGQVIGILRLIGAIGQYIQSISDNIWKRFPTAIWGEIAMNVALICLCICTAVLLFSHSRHFPRFFIAQMLCAIFLPLVDLFWVASIVSVSLNRPMTDFLTFEPRDGEQMVAGAIGAAIWIPYVLRSRRVANTFVK